MRKLLIIIYLTFVHYTKHHVLCSNNVEIKCEGSSLQGIGIIASRNLAYSLYSFLEWGKSYQNDPSKLFLKTKRIFNNFKPVS